MKVGHTRLHALWAAVIINQTNKEMLIQEHHIFQSTGSASVNLQHQIDAQLALVSFL